MNAPVRTWRTPLMKLHGELLRGRTRLGLTQAQMAARLGVGRATFQRWEDGRGDPRTKELFQWAHILGVEIGSVDCITNDAEAGRGE